MKSFEMQESVMKDDPLTRIQREIHEVTERENEFRKVHPTFARKMSESDIEVNMKSNGHMNGVEDRGQPKTMMRAMSVSHLINGSTPQSNGFSNGLNRRYTPNNGQRGIMQRFIASRGKFNTAAINTNTSPANNRQVYIAPAVTSPPIVARQPDGKPIRKGFVPVEEKIQKELQDLKDRETELKRQRKMSLTYQTDMSSLDLSDKEGDSESDDDVPLPGKLRVAKSIGELYEAMGDARSPSPYQASGPDSYGSMKPAKSLAELCELAPGEEALSQSSTKLIAKWESLIQQKQESGAA